MKPELSYPFYPCLSLCLCLLSPPLTYLVITFGHLLFFFFLILSFFYYYLTFTICMYIHVHVCLACVCVVITIKLESLKEGLHWGGLCEKSLVTEDGDNCNGKNSDMRSDIIPIVHHKELYFFKWVQTKEEGTECGEA